MEATLDSDVKKLYEDLLGRYKNIDKQSLIKAFEIANKGLIGIRISSNVYM